MVDSEEVEGRVDMAAVGIVDSRCNNGSAGGYGGGCVGGGGGDMLQQDGTVLVSGMSELALDDGVNCQKSFWLHLSDQGKHCTVVLLYSLPIILVFLGTFSLIR